MSDNFRADIQAILKRIPNDRLKAVQDLWPELNYDHADDLISTRQWPESERDALEESPMIIATAATNQDFKVIYCRLNTQLQLTPQRPIISRLLQDNPYSLFIFSNADQDDWHLVNVKYETPHPSPLPGGEGTFGLPSPSGRGAGGEGGVARRVFRRIRLGRGERLRTATERLSLLDVESLPRGAGALVVQQRHDEAFDVETVTKAFFSQYREVFGQVEAALTGLSEAHDRRLFTQSLFNRLLFIRFLERKGWLSFAEYDDYLNALWFDHSHNTPQQNFYNDRLRPLFFDALNQAPQGIRQSPLLGTVPYLNGGLFEVAELDKKAVGVPDAVLRPVIEILLYGYNFTVTESTPLDIEVAVDPEMLGKIFEELVTGRHESGSYYTPKPIVSFMGQEALKGYLQSATSESAETIARYVEQRDGRALRSPKTVLSALEAVKICDPACGSGAYLLGMLHELLDLQQALFVTNEVDAKTLYQTKLEIIQHNVYGVDLDTFAVNIARLRLWLSLIVEFEGETPPPLPNLDFKIEAGDSLTAPAPKPVQADMFRQEQINRYFGLKAAYLQAHGDDKAMLKQQIGSLKTEIAHWVHGNKTIPANAFDWEVEFAEVFTPKQAQATMKGQMAGIMNQAGGQLGLMEQPKAGGFDIVLANPPYVRHELIKELKPALQKGYPEVYVGTADLLVYFYARAWQLLKPNGMMAFISSNKFMRAGYGKGLRTLLSQKTALQAVVDFGDLAVFDATAYPVVLISQKQTPAAQHHFQALTVDDLTVVQRLPEVVKQHGWAQVQSSLTADNWNLKRLDALGLMTKLRAVGIPLGEFVKGGLYYGMKTGFNEAFVIDTPTRDKLIAQDAKSAELIKPWLRGRDVKKWGVEWANLWLIYSHCQVKEFDYPAIREHLLPYKDKLLARTGGANPKTGEVPYEWWQLQIDYYNSGTYKLFEQPKIVYQVFQVEPKFAYDTIETYSNNSIWIIPSGSLYLLGVLNSSMGWFLISQYCTAIQRGYQLLSNYFSKIPIATPTASQRAAIEGLVEKCLAARGQGSAVAAWEAEINRRVYEVYGLTAAEVALVEGGARVCKVG